MPSAVATPSSTIAWANEPPCLRAAADDRELVGATRPVAASRSATSSATALIGKAAAERLRLPARLEPVAADGAERGRLLFELVHGINPSNELSAERARRAERRLR